MQHDPARKPDPHVCPRQFCFFWQMAMAITAATPAPASVERGCRCSFGRCTRLDPEHGDRDWYESHGPNLRKAGLPWFYFIPSPKKLRVDFRQGYVEQSEALWGESHWENSP